MRRNIGKYLDQHINLPPATVLITAVLRTEVEGSSATDLGLHDLQQVPPTSPAVSRSGSSSSSDDEEQEGRQQQVVGLQPQDLQPADHPLTRLLLSCFGWLVTPSDPPVAAASSSATATTSSSSGSSGGRERGGGGADDPAPADAYAAVSTTSQHEANNTSNTNSSRKGEGQGPNVAALVNSALQRLSGSVASSLPQLRLQQKPQTRVVETLVGVAEVSFKERTRSQALTLNPPQVMKQVGGCWCWAAAATAATAAGCKQLFVE